MTFKALRKLALAVLIIVVVVIVVLTVVVARDWWWVDALFIPLAAVLGFSAHSLFEIVHPDSYAELIIRELEDEEGEDDGDYAEDEEQPEDTDVQPE